MGVPLLLQKGKTFIVCAFGGGGGGWGVGRYVAGMLVSLPKKCRGGRYQVGSGYFVLCVEVPGT